MDALTVITPLPTDRQFIIEENVTYLEDIISDIKDGKVESFMIVIFNTDGTHTYQATISKDYLFQIGVLTEMIHLRLGS